MNRWLYRSVSRLSFVNPRVFEPTKKDIRKLSSILGIDQQEIREISRKKAYFYWLKRKVSAEEEKLVKSLKVSGVYSVLEPSRFYPSQLASQLIGYVGTDNKGLLGLERQFDSQLRGQSDTNILSRDARGNLIHSQSSSAAPQKPGEKLFLSLDRVIKKYLKKH